jgi:branched-subunit amino acid ABC-type transport system permease component
MSTMAGAGGLVVALDGLAHGLALFLVAAGLSLALGVGHTLNLAHGTAYLSGAYLAWLCSDTTLAGLAAALALAAAVGAAGGAGLSALLARVPDQLDQALASIGLALLTGQLLTAAFGAEPKSVDPPAPLAGSLTLAGQGYPTYRLALIAVAAALATALWRLVHHTRAGAVMRAAGTDPTMIATIGVEARRVRAATLAGGVALATTAGVLAAPLLGPAPGVDHTVLILSLVIVVAGGAGSVPGALLAALAVGQVQTTAVAAWPHAAPYLVYAVLVAALVARATTRRHTAGPP